MKRPLKQDTHPQDVLALLLGLYALASPLWTTTSSRATMTMILLGSIIVMLSVAEIFIPDMLAVEGLTAGIGLLMVLSPIAMQYSDVRPMAWTAWIVGGLMIVIGIADIQWTRSHGKGWHVEEQSTLPMH